MCPMCGGDCTVAPQTYIPTRPACSGNKLANGPRAGVVQAQSHRHSLGVQPRQAACSDGLPSPPTQSSNSAVLDDLVRCHSHDHTNVVRTGITLVGAHAGVLLRELID